VFDTLSSEYFANPYPTLGSRTRSASPPTGGAVGEGGAGERRRGACVLHPRAAALGGVQRLAPPRAPARPAWKAFGPHCLPRIRELAQAHVAQGLAELGAAAEPDIVRDFAAPVPPRILSDLLGIPQADVPRFKRWTEQIFGLIDAGIVDERDARQLAAATTQFRRRGDIGESSGA
jgi:hypothetical protein